jgi:hypothetical protein
MQTWKLFIAGMGSLVNRLSPSARSLDDCITEIQRAMLQALAPAAAQANTSITRRIAQAEDIQTLWYLRADLMVALAGFHGEAQATETLRAVSNRFHALLPGRFSSRSSPLSHC